MPLPRSIAQALGDHLRDLGASADDLVFPAPEGGPLRLSLWRRRVWAPAVLRAGLEPLRIHDMRHTAVALWIEAGASPYEIASRAGHTSVAVVLDRYGHLLPGSEERVNDALDALARDAIGSARAIGRAMEALNSTRSVEMQASDLRIYVGDTGLEPVTSAV